MKKKEKEKLKRMKKKVRKKGPKSGGTTSFVRQLIAQPTFVRPALPRPFVYYCVYTDFFHLPSRSLLPR